MNVIIYKVNYIVVRKEITNLKSQHNEITADMKSKIKKLTRRVKLVNTIENALLELYLKYEIVVWMISIIITIIQIK